MNQSVAAAAFNILVESGGLGSLLRPICFRFPRWGVSVEESDGPIAVGESDGGGCEKGIDRPGWPPGVFPPMVDEAVSVSEQGV